VTSALFLLTVAAVGRTQQYSSEQGFQGRSKWKGAMPER